MHAELNQCSPNINRVQPNGFNKRNEIGTDAPYDKSKIFAEISAPLFSKWKRGFGK